jgi:hypothetical protein
MAIEKNIIEQAVNVERLVSQEQYWRCSLLGSQTCGVKKAKVVALLK